MESLIVPMAIFAGVCAAFGFIYGIYKVTCVDLEGEVEDILADMKPDISCVSCRYSECTDCTIDDLTAHISNSTYSRKESDEDLQ